MFTTNYLRKKIPGVAIKILSGVDGGLSKIGCPFFWIQIWALNSGRRNDANDFCGEPEPQIRPASVGSANCTRKDRSPTQVGGALRGREEKEREDQIVEYNTCND